MDTNPDTDHPAVPNPGANVPRVGTDARREQFEQVAAKVFGPRVLQHNEYDPDKYLYEHVQSRWVDWQFQIAALEAIEEQS